MHITIENGIDQYQGIYLEVQDWFTEKRGINWHVADIIKQTEKAILVKHYDTEIWIPKSIITVNKIPKGLDQWIS